MSDAPMQIGDRVKDKVSGFAGIAVGLTEYLNGCRQFLVKPERLNSEGKAVEAVWIDEQTLTIEKRQILTNPFAGAPVRRAPTAGGADHREPAQTSRRSS